MIREQKGGWGERCSRCQEESLAHESNDRRMIRHISNSSDWFVGADMHLALDTCFVCGTGHWSGTVWYGIGLALSTECHTIARHLPCTGH